MSTVDLRTTAVWLHELYEALIAAGFKPEDAVEMVSWRLPEPPGLEVEE